MPLLNTSVPNLAQGVSQQPDNLRFSGQCDEQINAWSTVVEGLVKRPNSRFSYDTALGANVNSNLFTHFVDRDEQNQYVLTYDSTNKLKVKDLTANSSSAGNLPVTVESADVSLYIAATNPLQDLRALTIADSTFIVNTAKTVTKETTAELKTQPLEKDALVFVKLGDYEKGYSIYLDELLVPVDTNLHNQHEPTAAAPPATYISGTSAAGTHADTEFIAKDLTTCLDTYVNGAGTLEVFALSGGSGLTAESERYYVSTFTFFVDQFDSGTKIGAGAGGTLTVVSGVVTGSVLTQKGTGYDSSVSTAAYNAGTGSGMLVTIKHTSEYLGWETRANKTYSDINYLTPGVVIPPITAVTVAGTTTKFTIERNGSIIKISSDTDFVVRVSDGLADQGLGAIYKEVDTITDLPKSCFNNFRVKIIGDAELDQDDYYVKFKSKDNEDFGEGSWVEESGWYQDGTNKGLTTGIDTFLNKDTMPVRLVPDQATGKITSFTLKAVNWRARTAGDDNTNPFPSFVNNKINDIFFFKNRLGLLTDDTVVFSEADEYFNFFRTTTQSLLDSAPIDVGISHTKISLLKYAQAFQGKLMLFSAKTQFVLRGADLLTPKTVTISPVTEYDVSESIRPLALSSHIYFNFKRNSFEGLLEYNVDNNTETYNAAEITQQVNKYIPSNIVRMEGSSSENIIVVQADTDYKKLFVYKYFWQGNEKVQSAWMSFTFKRDVRSFYFIESTLYIITTDSGGTYLEKIPMEVGLKDGVKDYALLLDSRLDQTQLNPVVYSVVTKLTTISGFPYDPSGVDLYTEDGRKLAFTRTTSSEGTVTSDLTGVPFYVGFPYDMLYRFSKQTLKQPTEKGGRSASNYSFQTIRSGSLNYSETGHFTVEVTPKYRDTYNYVFNPEILGSNLILNTFTPQDGHFKFPVQSKPEEAVIEIKSSSALPMKLLSAEFESTLISRSRRYGG